ncbi:pseudouridine synthase [Candidatus Epulonipiscioides gigas]|nr:pseudouridine synthase [Epulopiscium sp. SCG-C07WGA-EpuloA2]
MMRLQKYLATAGVASRRKCEEYIVAGKVKINNMIVAELGVKVNSNDIVQFENKIIQIEEKKLYYMLHKPKGYITSVKDENGRKTVIDLLQNKNERVYPVGRLDYNTSGILLLTNDGDFAYQLTHPKHTITKTYLVKVDGTVSSSEIQSLKNGVKIDDYVTKPAKVEKISEDDDTTTLQIIISEGKNRQIRKMCNKVGHNVLDLKRIAIGNVSLNGLKRGKIRELTKDEIAHFKIL